MLAHRGVDWLRRAFRDVVGQLWGVGEGVVQQDSVPDADVLQGPAIGIADGLVDGIQHLQSLAHLRRVYPSYTLFGTEGKAFKHE